MAQSPEAEFAHWKFRHPDGREWIAFRVGVFLVDTIEAATGQNAEAMIWTPVEESEALPSVRAFTSER